MTKAEPIIQRGPAKAILSASVVAAVVAAPAVVLASAQGGVALDSSMQDAVLAKESVTQSDIDRLSEAYVSCLESELPLSATFERHPSGSSTVRVSLVGSDADRWTNAQAAMASDAAADCESRFLAAAEARWQQQQADSPERRAFYSALAACAIDRGIVSDRRHHADPATRSAGAVEAILDDALNADPNKLNQCFAEVQATELGEPETAERPRP